MFLLRKERPGEQDCEDSPPSPLQAAGPQKALGAMRSPRYLQPVMRSPAPGLECGGAPTQPPGAGELEGG